MLSRVVLVTSAMLLWVGYTIGHTILQLLTCCSFWLAAMSCFKVIQSADPLVTMSKTVEVLSLSFYLHCTGTITLGLSYCFGIAWLQM